MVKRCPKGKTRRGCSGKQLKRCTKKKMCAPKKRGKKRSRGRPSKSRRRRTNSKCNVKKSKAACDSDPNCNTRMTKSGKFKGCANKKGVAKGSVYEGPQRKRYALNFNMRSKSRSRSPMRKSRSRSPMRKSRSRSRSRSPKRRSRSRSRSRSPKRCDHGTKKNGRCSKKRGPKRGTKNNRRRKKNCKFGTKKSGACKKRGGPKRKRKTRK